MLNIDEDALICDFAETYHIYDYRALPLKTVAVLAAGLRDNSRIKMKAVGTPVDQTTILLAAIADRVEAFRLGFCKDPKDPVSLLDMLLGNHKQQNHGIETFASGEELMAVLHSKQQEAE